MEKVQSIPKLSLRSRSHRREKQQADGSASGAPVVELLDSLRPVSPCLSKKAGDSRILALLQRPDFDVAHALATAHEQPLWIRQKAAEEEAEIDVLFKNGEVQNLVNAGICQTIP
jgi:hypothetical protein